MNLSTILKPPSPRADKPAPVEERHPVIGARLARNRRRRRVLAVGLVLSVAIHLLAVVISPLIVRYVTPDSLVSLAPPPIPAAEQGTLVIEYTVTETPRVEPEPLEEPEQPEPEPPTATTGTGETDEALTAAERLRPRVGDWRLWVRSPVTERESTPAEREADLNAQIHSRIAALNDSIAAEDASRAESMDWTVGEEGEKWGISPGKIHLGPLTLPLPFSFGPSREDAATAAEWEAIQRQAGQGVIDEAFEERVKAIRERRERERAEAEAKKDTTSSN